MAVIEEATIDSLTKQINVAELDIRDTRKKREIAQQKLSENESTYQKTLLLDDRDNAAAKAIMQEIQVGLDKVVAMEQAVVTKESEVRSLAEQKNRLIAAKEMAGEEKAVNDLVALSETEAAKAIQQVRTDLEKVAAILTPLRAFQSKRFPLRNKTVSAARTIDQQLTEVLNTTIQQIDGRRHASEVQLENEYLLHLRSLAQR